jgi:hypothetical protein
MKKLFFCLFIAVFYVSFCQAQFNRSTDTSDGGEKWACYAKTKVLIPSGRKQNIEDLDKIEWKRQPYFIYQGTDTSALIKEIVVYDKLPTEKWVKHKAALPCLRNKSGELSCGYDVRTEEGGTKTKIRITKDTAHFKPFYVDYYYPLSKNQQWLDSVEGTEDSAVEEEVEENRWQKVLCDTYLTPFMIDYIATQLEKEGLLHKEDLTPNVLGTKTKAALTAYQRKYGLPIGTLNLKTLEVMGIRFEER